MKYKVGDRVRTGYGTGKIIKARLYTKGPTSIWCYRIKYGFFTKLWCFEFSVEEKIG